MEIIFLLKIEKKKTKPKFCNVNIKILITVVDELNLIHLCLKFELSLILWCEESFFKNQSFINKKKQLLHTTLQLTLINRQGIEPILIHVALLVVTGIIILVFAITCACCYRRCTCKYYILIIDIL